MSDLVSIIMPSYNTAKFIGDSIESVLNQTYTNWELIIVDDCSTDDTDKIVNNFKDSRIKYLKNKKNLGAALTRNKALREAGGTWIAFLDSDDIWLPKKLEHQLNFMKRNGYNLSFTDYEKIDEKSKPMNIYVSGPHKVNRSKIYKYDYIGQLTVMYNAKVFGIIQIKDIRKNNDYAMWLKIIKRANCYHYDKVLAQYRKRSGSISNHGYLKLIKWHYKLFKEADSKNSIISLLLTFQNLAYGCWKKIRYVKKVS